MHKVGVTNKTCKHCKIELQDVYNGTIYCSTCRPIVRKNYNTEWVRNKRNNNPIEYKNKYKQYRKISKENFDQIGVYVVFDLSGNIIYVGRTNNFNFRMKRHYLVKSPWLTEASSIDFIKCDTFGDSLVEEAILIRDFQPKYNKDGVTR